MEQALLFFDFSKNIEQDVYHNGELDSMNHVDLKYFPPKVHID